MQLLVVFASLAIYCDGARILGVFNHPGASHTFLGKVLLKSMAARGHEVVMISAFPMEKPINNYRDIALPGLLEDLKRRERMYFNKDSTESNLSNMTIQHSEDVFKDAEVKKLIQSSQVFDLVLIDFFYNDAMLIFGHIVKAPVIILSSFGNNLMTNMYTGNSLPISYVPGLGLAYDDNLSLKQRLVMTLGQVILPLMQLKDKKMHQTILKRHFDNPPSIDELEQNIVLVLSNSHFSIETPRPYTPNIIPIGGFHVEEPEKLPKDLQKFLDESINGVVYFSLGSQIKSSNLKQEQIDIITKVLGELPMNVLWKFEGEHKTVSKNIKLVKWAPQTSILAHPNVKIFVTHGGVLSLIESVHFGVPLICIPFLGDQFLNGQFIESREIGKLQKVEDLSEAHFSEVLQALMTNAKYQENIQKHSLLLRGQPIKPLDNAIYWMEQAIIHRSIAQIKPYSLQIAWYKYYLLDVIATVLTVLVLLIILLKKLAFALLKLLAWCRRRPKSQNKNKPKRN